MVRGVYPPYTLSGPTTKKNLFLCLSSLYTIYVCTICKKHTCCSIELFCLRTILYMYVLSVQNVPDVPLKCFVWELYCICMYYLYKTHLMFHWTVLSKNYSVYVCTICTKRTWCSIELFCLRTILYIYVLSVQNTPDVPLNCFVLELYCICMYYLYKTHLMLHWPRLSGNYIGCKHLMTALGKSPKILM